MTDIPHQAFLRGQPTPLQQKVYSAWPNQRIFLCHKKDENEVMRAIVVLALLAAKGQETVTIVVPRENINDSLVTTRQVLKDMLTLRIKEPKFKDLQERLDRLLTRISIGPDDLGEPAKPWIGMQVSSKGWSRPFELDLRS